MELLLHLNKRIRSRPEIQLPIDALLQQYQDSRATSFVLVNIQIYVWENSYEISLFVYYFFLFLEFYYNLFDHGISKTSERKANRTNTHSFEIDCIEISSSSRWVCLFFYYSINNK